MVWDAFKDALAGMHRNDIHRLIKHARKELTTRHEEAQANKQRVGAAMTGMANVMAGVTWALACRQSLRRSKGHTPDYGVKPASGEMWLPRELLYALRHEVKERAWSPLSQATAEGTMRWLTAEGSRTPRVSNEQADLFEAQLAGNASKFDVAHFKVRMAKQTAAAIIDVPVD